MSGRLLAIGAVLAAFFASLCCIGPLVLAALGISSLGLTTLFEPYRFWLIGLALVLVAVGFYVAHKKRACCGADACSTRSHGKIGSIWWALVVLFIASLVVAPRMMALMQGHTTARPICPSCLSGD